MASVDGPKGIDSPFVSRALQAPVVGQYMSAAPHSIGIGQSLDLAAERMGEYGVRHLPVLDGGQLVGVLSERDVALIASVVPQHLSTLTVEEAMTAVPYCVPADAPLARVAEHMALRKLGSALVTEHGNVVGIFTVTDALIALSTLLDGHTAETPAASG